MKEIHKINTFEYTAIFEKAPEGGYSVSVPALHGCISEGDTFEEAEANIKEAIELYLEVLREKQKTNYFQREEIFLAPVRLKLKV